MDSVLMAKTARLSSFKALPPIQSSTLQRQRRQRTQVRIQAVAAPPRFDEVQKVKNVDMRDDLGGNRGGLYTSTNPEKRRVKPSDPKGRVQVKLVYVVLEAQYQSAVSSAVKRLNKENDKVCFEVVGYLLEELRSDVNFEMFKRDVQDCNIFIGSLIFIEDLADKIISVVQPRREQMDACVIFPSMPAVMKLNKIGQFSMSNLGQSKSIFSDLVKKAKQNEAFEESMLKIVRTLPKILKFLPSEKARDVKNFVVSLQYWLGGNQQNMENLLKNIAQEYVPALKDAKMKIEDPQLFTEVGIWHPMATSMFESYEDYFKWYNSRTDLQTDPAAPTIGVVLQKSHLITGDAGHYEGVVMEIEARGGRVIPVFSGGLDFGLPVKKFFINGNGQPTVDCVLNLTGFALVGGPARQDSERAIAALKKLNVPYLVSLPLIFQTTEEWMDSDLGLHPVQVALQVALPEIDGGMEPIIFAGRDSNTGKAHSIPDRINSVCARAVNWAKLRKLQNAQKKLAVTIFSFPPDKGNIGTAAYLNVFSSIYKVMENLRQEGYDVGAMPESDEALMQQVLQQSEAKYNSADLNVHYRMNVREYSKLCDYAPALEENWGKPPGKLNSSGSDLLIYGKQFGNVFIGVQPTFGYEGDPMRLLFSRSASPHHGFAAFYTYVEKIFGADAVLHFGTHGSLEFMPGKQVGMSGICYPDSLIGHIPNVYYYAANNPSEATIAKRRSYAATISYLTPPAENAGLYKGLKELKELVSSYQSMRESGRAVQIISTIIETARQCNLDRDVALPSSEEEKDELDLEARDLLVGGIYRQLMEIESRLLPCGLHVVGVPPTCEEAVATLVNIAEVDRPEGKPPVKGLPGILARSIDKNIEQIYALNNKGQLDAVEELRTINEGCRTIIQAFVAEKTDGQNRVKVDGIGSRIGRMFGQGEEYLKALQETPFKNANKEELRDLFAFLQFCIAQIVQDRELEALTEALDGNYVQPGPGGDPIRNPGILPTGKNIHALDPQSIPTMAAVKSAKVVVERLIEREKQQAGGTYPETIALVLWGTDNIKTYGESLAQVLCMLGVEPVSDALGRVNKLKVIPLEELKRPRIDVVVNCSGVFRDLFVNQMILLDRAVKLVAELDEPQDMNFVRKHALEQAEKLGCSFRDAATRVFSNSSGSYSSNVNLAVENSSWQDEKQLQDMYLSRKSYAFNSDRPGAGGEENRQLFEQALGTATVTFQNLDSSEISLTDVSHYFDSDPTNLVQNLRKDGKKPNSYIADTTTANAQVRSLSETVRLDARTKLLNPKWYEGMMKSGYEGVREIQKRLNNTMGWSATSGQVDNWVYNEANDTFINDAEMAERMMKTNPNSFRKLVANFLEASGRGYWDASEQQLERLKELYMDVEDKIEGVD